MVVKPMYTEDKPFLSLIPLVFTKPFLKNLRPLSNVVLHFSPTSRGAIAALNTSLPPDDYIASGWFSYFPLGAIAGYLVHSYLLTQAIDAPRAALVGVIIMGFVVGTFTWVNLRHAHSVMKERAQEIDKYLLYALRDFSLQLQSGATVFKALVAVANAGYNHVVVDHTKDIYVVDGSTTNGFEGYWSQLKRGIYGIYHQVRPTHLGTLSISFISIY